MGYWKTARGYGGDSFADELDNCMHRLSNVGKGVHREITMLDFADLIEFCSRGHIKTELRHPEDGNRPLSKLHDKDVKTRSNRGQIHCPETCKSVEKEE